MPRSKLDAIRAGREYLDRQRERALKGFRAFYEGALKRPISTFDLRYCPDEERIVSETVALQLGDLELSVHPNPTKAFLSGGFTPATGQAGSLTVMPLGLVLTPIGTIVAIRVSNGDPAWRPKLNWYRKTDPSMSAVYFIDPVNDTYIYPVDSSLRGDLVAGVPKTGLLVFERFRQITDTLELHISEVPCGAARGRRATFVFHLHSEVIREATRTLVEGPSLEKTFQETLDRQLEEEWSQSALGGRAGCAIVLTSALVASGIGCLAALNLTG